MTLHAIRVPNWGLAMEEGTLAAWLVAEGASVATGDEIADIETSKIANVLESPFSGRLVRQVAAVGDVRPVGALLGVIADAAETAQEIDAFVAGAVEATAKAAVDFPAVREPERIDVAGQSLLYLKLPAAVAASRLPVILVHGFGGDHRNWMFNQQALAADRDAYAVDLPGHGGSGKTVGDGSLCAIAGQLSAFLDALGLGRVHLVGHSLGAAVAATLALDQPQRVASLIAICGAGFGGPLDRAYIEGFVAATRRKDLRPFVEQLFFDPSIVTREMVDDLVAYKRIDGVSEAIRSIADGALSSGSLNDLQSRLARLEPPLLNLFASDDQITPTSPAVAGSLIERSGHMPHLEAAAAVNPIMQAFLKEQD